MFDPVPQVPFHRAAAHLHLAVGAVDEVEAADPRRRFAAMFARHPGAHEVERLALILREIGKPEHVLGDQRIGDGDVHRDVGPARGARQAA